MFSSKEKKAIARYCRALERDPLRLEKMRAVAAQLACSDDPKDHRAARLLNRQIVSIDSSQREFVAVCRRVAAQGGVVMPPPDVRDVGPEKTRSEAITRFRQRAINFLGWTLGAALALALCWLLLRLIDAAARRYL